MADDTRHRIVVRGGDIEDVLTQIVASGLLSEHEWEMPAEDISEANIELSIQVPKAAIDSIDFDEDGTKILPIVDEFECTVAPKVFTDGNRGRVEHTMRLVRRGDTDDINRSDGSEYDE